MINICIVGCGALGGIFGAHLARLESVTVWAYDRNEPHVRAINEQGLILRGINPRKAPVRATTDADTIPACDFGIVATKFAHTRPALEETRHLFADGVVCSVQNGIGSEEIIADYVDRVACGTTMLGGHVIAPGTIDFDTNGPTWVGPADTHVTLDETRVLASILTESGLETHAIGAPLGMKWSKLIFNAAANAPCALTGLTFGEMYQNTALRQLMYGLAEEGKRVARALDISLHSDPVPLLDNAATTAAAHVPSMLTDVRQRVATEVAALNGGIVRYGDQTGTPCPLNRTMQALISGLEQSWKTQ